MADVEERYCPICTRHFYGDAINFDGDVCHYCHIELEKGKSVEQVALEKKRLMESFSPSAMRKRIREAEARDREECIIKVVN